MRKAINYIIYILVLCTGISCKKNMKTPDYVRYINNKNNGLIKTTQTDGWEYDVQYRPGDYIILMENKGVPDDSVLNKREAELKGTAWFNIVIKRIDNQVTPLRYDISSLDEYDTRLNYFLNEAAKDIKLVNGKDTLLPKSYLFENNYNLTPQETMIVGFYLPAGDNYPIKDMQLSYIDKVFKNGIIRAQFSKTVLNHIPNLIY